MKRSRNIIARIISLFILLLALFVTIPTSVTYASYQGNGNNKNDGSDIGKNSDEAGRVYASYSKTGWLVYVTDTSGKLVSSVVYVNAGSSFPTGYNTKCLRSRIGKVQANTEKNYTNAPWGYPFVTNGDARGLEIRNEIVKTTKNYSGDKNTTNMQYIIKHYLGDKMYETVAQDPDNYYLILEACAYHSAYNGAGQKVGDVLASAYGWAYLNKINGLPKTGDGRNGWCDQYRLQRSCYLNKNWTGLPKVPTNFAGSTWNSGADGISTDYLLGNYGYGMIAIRATEGGIELTTRLGAQSTCDEEKITKAHSSWYETPEDGKINGIKTKVTYDKNGIAKKIESVPTTYEIKTDRNIVKTYLTKIQYVDKKGNVVKDEEGNEIVEYKIDSAYKIRQNCMPYIRIEDETKEAALENYRIASLTDPITIDFVHDIIKIGYSEKDYEKMHNKIESKKEEDCYSIDRWYVTTGKVLKSSTVEDGILTSDNSNIRLKSLLTENGKTITGGGKHQVYVDLNECTDTKGKPSKNVYIVLTKTVQKPYYQSTCDEDHVEKNDSTIYKLPHAAPNESNSGNCTIVKTYITKTVSKDTNGVEIGATYKVDNDYLVKHNSISKIDIEDEVVNGKVVNGEIVSEIVNGKVVNSEVVNGEVVNGKGVYKLAKYIVTSGKVIPNDKFHPITSDGSATQFEYNIKTENNKNIVATGDTPATITLDKHSKNGEKGKILYVYLMREIELINTTKNES